MFSNLRLAVTSFTIKAHSGYFYDQGLQRHNSPAD